MVSVNSNCFSCLFSHSAPQTQLRMTFNLTVLKDTWLETGVILKLNQSVVLVGALPERAAGRCSSPHHRAAFWPWNHVQKHTTEAENIVSIVLLLNVEKKTVILTWNSDGVLCKYKMIEHRGETKTRETTQPVGTTVHNWRKTSSYQFLFEQSIVPPSPSRASHFPAIRTFPDTGTVPSCHTCLHFTPNNVFILACCYNCCFLCCGIGMDVWGNGIPKNMHSSVSWNWLYA